MDYKEIKSRLAPCGLHCGNTGFDKHLNERSVMINNRMKEIGVKEYYNEVKDKPRY